MPKKTPLKYGNNPIWYDTKANRVITSKPSHKDYIYFDSSLEFEVYKILLSRFASEHITVHKTVVILPNCINCKAVTWSIDFYIKTETHEFYVEAKGFKTDDYLLKLNLLQRFKPLIHDLLFIVESHELSKFAHKIATFELWEPDVRTQAAIADEVNQAYLGVLRDDF